MLNPFSAGYVSKSLLKRTLMWKLLHNMLLHIRRLLEMRMITLIPKDQEIVLENGFSTLKNESLSKSQRLFFFTKKVTWEIQFECRFGKKRDLFINIWRKKRSLFVGKKSLVFIWAQNDNFTPVGCALKHERNPKRYLFENDTFKFPKKVPSG